MKLMFILGFAFFFTITCPILAQTENTISSNSTTINSDSVTNTIATNSQNISNSINIMISGHIPKLFNNDDIFSQLQDTVWVHTDLKNNKDRYVSFKNNQYGNVGTIRGEIPKYPDKTYPMMFYRKGTDPYEGIFIIVSSSKMSYYAFRFLTPYYLLISPGYSSPQPLSNLSLNFYLEHGYLLHLIY